MTDAERPNGTSWRVLRRRDFAIFWSAALVSSTAAWMQLIAVPFVIYQMTKSTTWLGIAAVAGFVPHMCSSLVGGPLADRHSRKNILFVTQSMMMFWSFLLWLVWVQGWESPGLIVAIVFANGLVAGCNVTTWQAFVTQLVDRDELLDAVRVNSLQFTVSRAVGPALAGLVLQTLGASTAFFVNAATYPLVLAALLVIRPHAQTFVAGSESVTARLREGVHLVHRDSTLLLSVVATSAVAFFGISLIQLTPAFAKEFFHVGKGAYGLMVASFGVGALVGSVLTVVIADRVLRSTVALCALIGMAFGIVGLAVAPTYGLGLVALFVMGAMYLMITTPVTVSLQARVADTHRGRVMSLYMVSLVAGVPFGALIAGRLASSVSLHLVLVGYGIALLLFVVFAVLRFDRLRPLDATLEDTAADVVDEPVARSTASPRVWRRRRIRRHAIS